MRNQRKLVLSFALALLMLATRTDHFGSSLSLPDASLAVFFLAGFYLRGKFVFPLLLAEAGLIDYVAIAHFGVSDFCVSPAYVFLIPAYAAPWAAGFWLRRRLDWNWRSLAPLTGALFAGVFLAFLFSNGSFYWLSGRYPDPNWSQYVERGMHYFPPYLSGAFLYVTLAAFLHILLHALPLLRASSGHERGA